jgi:signal transduction histidine kinase
VSPMWQVGAEPNYHIAIVEDITERKRAEQNTIELLQQNRSLTQRLFTVQEEERRYLAQELHDEFGQLLTAMDLHVKSIANSYGRNDEDTHKSIRALDGITTHMYRDIRSLIHRLRPVLLDELGLADSLRDLIAQWQENHPGVDCDLLLEADLTELGETLDITVYRTVQEALTNVARHAEASRVEIRIRREQAPDSLLLSIKDNGKGKEASLPTTGMGLPGMRERVLAIGGEFTAQNGVDGGFCINLSLPLQSPEGQ